MPLDNEHIPAEVELSLFAIRGMGDQARLIGKRVKASKYTILVPLADGKRALAYNTRTTSFAVLDQADVKALKALERQEVAKCEGALEVLGATGFLAPAELEETEAVRQEYWAARSRPDLLTITIAPTLGCNVSCHYCFQGLAKPTGKMSVQVQDALLAYVGSRIHELNDLQICWYGGEPLMDQRAIARLSENLLALCNDNGVRYSAMMVTNGYLLDARAAQRLHDFGVTMAQVTIDGTEAAHDANRPLTSGRGTYQRTLANMKAVLTNTPFSISVRCNIGIENAETISDLLDELSDEGFDTFPNFSIYFYPIEATTEACASAEAVGLLKAEFAELQRSLERKAFAYGLSSPVAPARFEGLCVAAQDNGLVIGPDGEVHRCWETLHDETKQVGTVFDMAALAENKLNKRWNAWDPFDNPICSACKIAPMCAGFCSYKFIYADSTAGESGALPCPKWKFNTAEYIFEMAETQGFVTARDWDPEQATAIKMQGGQRHSFESVAAVRDQVNQKVEEMEECI